MSVQTFASFPAQTAPIGLLALNAGREASRHEAATAAPVIDLQAISPEAGSTVRVSLRRMGVVLSISAESANGTADDAAFAIPAASEAEPSDPVVVRLLRELGQTEHNDDAEGVYGDAMRLALVARWLRSRPAQDVQQDVNGGALQKWRLKRVMTYIDEHITEAIPLADLARAAGLSRMYFAAQFRAATGLRPHEYILRRRIERAKDMLVRTNESLVEIAFNVGFQTQAHFTTVFKRFAGVTPGRWRSSNRQFA